jgi:NodT family efflux transporter outer membrane factor (OMF) lipoprotein
LRAQPVVAAVIALAGCADMAGIGSQAKLRDASSLGIAPDSAAAPVSTLDTQWWLAFGDTQLNSLIDQAVAGNPNLQVAQARLARAQASADIAGAALKPQVNGELDLNRQKFNSNYIYPAPLGGSTQNIGLLQLGASWELDFFGKNRSALEAASARRAPRRPMSMPPACCWPATSRAATSSWARLNDQLTVAKRTLSQRDEHAEAGARPRARRPGHQPGTAAERRRACPKRASRSKRCRSRSQLTRNALAALVGQPNVSAAAGAAGARQRKPMALPATPGRPAGPPRRHRRRPLARRSGHQRREANAKAQFYPNVNLTASSASRAWASAAARSRAASSGAWARPSSLPIFDAGRLRANLRGKSADLDVAVESYNGAVLDAVRDAADQVVQRPVHHPPAGRAARRANAAEGAYDIAVQRYRAGLGTYLNVLTAETAVLNQRRLAVDLAAARSTRRCLARALGGGFQPDADTLRRRPPLNPNSLEKEP